MNAQEQLRGLAGWLAALEIVRSDAFTEDSIVGAFESGRAEPAER